MSAIDQGRYTVAAGAVGLAQACLDASVRYAHERETFGEEIGRHQLVKQMIANMAKGIEIGRLLVFQAGCAQEPRPAQHARDVARQVARDRPLGAGRARRDPDPRRQRLLATSSRSSATCATRKAAVIYEGTSQLHTLIQADYALGYREDRPLRCEPWPAQGYERG